MLVKVIIWLLILFLLKLNGILYRYQDSMWNNWKLSKQPQFWTLIIYLYNDVSQSLRKIKTKFYFITIGF